MQDDHGMARMQEILSSYYGMQDKESEEESQRNIDSQAFNSNVYVREMLQTMGLNDLLKRDDQLIREIKELDTNMQMLVYENYNKFISATDTIRKMKNNVATMETEVEKVVKSMDVITDKSESINVALAPHRSRVEKLIGVRRLLKRLEFIFDLPQRLNTAVKQEEYANATKYFLLARRILGRYEHITSFKAIQSEADAIIQNLEEILSNRLRNENVSSEQICETITLLTQLDACTEEMRQQFLDWHQIYFDRLVDTHKDQRPGESVAAFLRRINDNVLKKIAKVFEVYKANFLPELVAKEKTSGLRSSTAFQDDAFATFAKDTFGLYLRMCSIQLRRPHSEFGNPSEMRTDSQDNDYDDDINPSGEAEEEYLMLMYVLKQFVADVKEVDRIIPPCRLVNGAIEMVESCIRAQIESVFRKLRVETIELLRDAHHKLVHAPTGSSVSKNVHPPAQELARTFTEMMKQVLRQMEPLVQTGAAILKEMSRVFSDLVQVQFYRFLKWFDASLLLYTEPRRAFEKPTPSAFADDEEQEILPPWLEPTPQFILFLAWVCRELSIEGIGECLQVLIECLPANSPAAAVPASSAFSPTHAASARRGTLSAGSADVTHMIQVVHETSNELLLYVAKLYGNQLCAMVIRGMETMRPGWSELEEEPRTVQDSIEQLIETTFRFGREIALALGDEQSAFASGINSRTGSRDFRRRTGALRSRGGTSMSGVGMQMDIERIFAKRIQIFQASAEFTADWFVLALLKMVIKAYGEYVRMYEFSKSGLQQIQLNAEFLRSTTINMVPESQELESLLSDVLSNARERALNDVLMEQSSVVAIVSTRSAQILTKKSTG